MTASARSPFPDGSDGGAVSLEDFHAAVEVGACVVVDVREPHEFAVGRIPVARIYPCRASTQRTCPRADRSCSSARRALDPPAPCRSLSQQA